MSNYFRDEELACKCGRPDCDAKPFDPTTRTKLERLRVTVGSPLIVTSGRRCIEHNTQIKGSKKSQHLEGRAVDISFGGNSELAFRIVRVAMQLGFTGIGVGATFVHLDTRPGNAKLWGYPAG